MTTSGRASATAFRSAAPSKTSTTTGSKPIWRSRGAFPAERVVPTTRQPSARRSGASRRPMAPVAPARKRVFFMICSVGTTWCALRRWRALGGGTRWVTGSPGARGGAPRSLAAVRPSRRRTNQSSASRTNFSRGLPAELALQVGERLGREEVLEGALHLAHEEVDAAHPGDAPGRRLLAEEGAVRRISAHSKSARPGSTASRMSRTVIRSGGRARLNPPPTPSVA